MGRPSKYQPEFCEQLVEHMTQGYSFASFGAITDVCRDTLYEWADVHEDFSYAKKIGTVKSMYFWEGKLLSASHPESGVNPAPIIYSLKCRFGGDWINGKEKKVKV